MRPHRVLRRVAEPARHRACDCLGPPRDHELRTRRGVVLLVHHPRLRGWRRAGAARASAPGPAQAGSDGARCPRTGRSICTERRPLSEAASRRRPAMTQAVGVHRHQHRRVHRHARRITGVARAGGPTRRGLRLRRVPGIGRCPGHGTRNLRPHRPSRPAAVRRATGVRLHAPSAGTARPRPFRSAEPRGRRWPIGPTQGLDRVYVDGGQVISAFLAEGLIDDLVLTTAPVLLGDGLPLFHPGGRPADLLLDGVQTWPSGFVSADLPRPSPRDAYADRRFRVVTPRASSPTMNRQMIATSHPMVGSGNLATSLTASTA